MAEIQVVVANEEVQEKENKSEELVLDKFGRDEAERTITLESDDAEAINIETEQGKWQSYGDALHYVIARGLAEIKRTRDAAMKLMEQRTLKTKRDQWSKLLQSNPALVTNADLIASMMKELGVITDKK